MSKNFILFLELLICIIYIYLIIIFCIYVKPSKLTLLLFFSYCYISTYSIIFQLQNFNGNKKLMVNITYEYQKYLNILIFLYAIFCCMCYIIIYYSWEIYKKNYLYQIILILLPLIYLFQLKLSENILKSNYSFIFNFLEKLLSRKLVN